MKNLQELELVVEVVFEPQLQAIEIAVPANEAVALRKARPDLGRIVAESRSEEFGAHGRELFEAPGPRHRSVMQRVAPRQDRRLDPGGPQPPDGAVAVGDEELAQPRQRPR